jgi:hypothetical protein
VVGFGGGVAGGSSPPVIDEEEHGEACGGCEAPRRGGRGAEPKGAAGGAGEGANWVRTFISTRRARFDPEGKRGEYLRRLEGLMERIDVVLDGEGRAGKGELRAMDVMIRAVRACYVMVRDADVEALEVELERLERARGEAEGEAGGELGYRVEEDAPR